MGWLALEEYFFSNTVAERASRFCFALDLAIWDGPLEDFRVLLYCRRFGGNEPLMMIWPCFDEDICITSCWHGFLHPRYYTPRPL